MAVIIGKSSSPETLKGGTDPDTLIGGIGTNTLFGGGGADKFTVSVRNGDFPGATDTVMDFQKGSDRIDVSAYGISSFDQLQKILVPSSADPNDASLNAFYDGQNYSMRIVGISVAQLSSKDFIFSTAAAGSFQGTSDSDRIFGTTGADTLKGLTGDDGLFGGLGADTLIGGGGTNTLYGGPAADKFVVSVRDGSFPGAADTIKDFQKGGDKIDVSAYGISSFDQLQKILVPSSADPNDASFNAFYDGQNYSMRIVGIDVAQLSSADFIFSTAAPGTFQGTGDSDRIFGTTGTDTLKGLAGDDGLFGGAGTDTLIGGGGTNTLYGGSSADKFTVSVRDGAFPGAADTVMDFQKGSDRIDVSAYGISSFDQLQKILVPSAADPNDASFNAFYDGQNYSMRIVGTGVSQLSSADFIFSTAAPGTFQGTSDGDRIFGSTGADTLKGLTGDDGLFGGAGTDTLIGGRGTNTLYGGSSADKFVVSVRDGAFPGAADTVMDFQTGSDRIDVSAYGISSFDQLRKILVPSAADPNDASFNAFYDGQNYSMRIVGIDVAQLSSKDFIFSTAAPGTIQGTDDGDRIFGTTGADTLKGLTGDDGLFGGLGADTLIGGRGTNTLYGGPAADKFVVSVRDGVFPGATDIVMDFQKGGDRIDVSAYGISSFDQLQKILVPSSGNPNDASFNAFYDGQNYSMRIVGIDVAKLSSADFIFSTAAPGTFQGTGDGDRIFGTTGGDTLKGLAGDDGLFGGSGNDSLNGGLGDDSLYGGSGSDAFVFDSALSNNIDRIHDFSVSDDTIRLDDAVFAAFAGKSGAILSGNLRTNTTGLAQDSSDYIIYDSNDGRLYYDADGLGGAAGIQFATIGVGLALTNADFVVI